ncbi:DUF418 domain-containing protein [Nocardiopsis composta]|uniref:Putative membrane protein YeiB n=1 Tax=Nocardiopsis composta TaxID=157465 RepID=A0A7W8QRT4_9ACTN|nr:DUF418 domain-containing protein [Nocardiopsis composta]MBB5434688.1 putative membrane protein YeiB [Nocardiopsis composta]
MAEVSAGAGPTALRERAPAPDLARGFMLLFIALVNAAFFLTGPDIVATAADRAVVLVRSVLVDARSIPLFSLLFGYGTVQLLRRAGGEERTDGPARAGGPGWPAARRLLRRRGVWMLLIGLVHAVLLLPVDIIGAYGLALVALAGLLRLRDRALAYAAGGLAAASVALNTALSRALPPETGGSVEAGSIVLPDFASAASERLAEWTVYTPVTLLTVVLPPMLVGVWAARRRILEEPGRHRRMLAATAWWGLGIAVAGGLPDALVQIGAWTGLPGRTEGDLAILHDAVGWAGGLGWAALIALVSLRLGERRGAAARAVEAVGQRSMTCYLLQSAVFSAVFAPYALGMGAELGAASAAAVAVATWAATLYCAALMHTRGHRGPAETLLRRLTYGRPAPVRPPG